ncbi:HRD3 [[Candida] subhashii]|uniref:HRD3 n=1 Tax=[Candida] subhashii TaxID=561895 RepID=A0A8J5UGI1_9ASCO|nr:HRD3 [[Candida] subhashii]KAG7662478.1 HRD3 [[Candida] subhashii]
MFNSIRITITIPTLISLLSLLSFTLAFDKDGELYYLKAIKQLNDLTIPPIEPIYNLDNIEGSLYIPQFDNTINKYIQNGYQTNQSPPSELIDSIIPLLEKSAECNNVNAIVTLADLYFFGNYSLPTNYTKAIDLYHKATSISSNGHAYFILGLVYSTGLFGYTKIDQNKANLYYQFGMQNGDINSLLVLAYRYNKGIAVPHNCETALNYYVRLAEMGYKWLQTHDRDIDYNIRISDFNGGLYGEKMSETPNSIEIQSKVYTNLIDQFEEHKLNADDHEYVNLYYTALEYYKGDYFIPKNLTKALEIFQECVDLGELTYGFNNYANIDTIDQVFLSSCQAKLGRMYLKGLGTTKNITKAYELYQRSFKVQRTADALNDLGQIAEKGLVGPANITKAAEYYGAAFRKKSAEGGKNLAKLMYEMSGGQNSTTAKDMFTHMKEAVYLGNTEALYHFGNYLQMGVNLFAEPDKKYTCPSIIQYYQIFIERLSEVFAPHLKFAFNQLIQGDFNGALIGYSIAAEQGFEAAQISAAYLLYQLQPLISQYKNHKTFTKDRVDVAIRYLDRASRQGNVDATILLGDIYSGSDSVIPISPDYDKAFNYYRIASDRHSSHGSYKLAQMYEYGIGPVNNSIDYFMAKRYYDSSLQYKEQSDIEAKLMSKSLTYSKAHINLALLRLRLKYLFNKKAFKESSTGESGGWFHAFRNVKSNSATNLKESVSKADAHHEGTTYVNDDGVENYVEDYDIGDYLVICLTFIFFVAFFVQNLIRQIRRIRMRNNNNNQNNQVEGQNGENENGENNEGEGARVGLDGFHFRRGNFEFHFFAI